MTNTTHNTGRTVTINLDTLGNAAVFQIFEILTDSTYDWTWGEKEEASEASDLDAAMEVWLHIAETADDRAAGADARQRHIIEMIVEEYKEIFESDPADDLRARLEEEAANEDLLEEEPEEAANEEDPEDIFKKAEKELDALVEEIRRDRQNRGLNEALEADARDINNGVASEYRAGHFAGLAAALGYQINHRLGRTYDDDHMVEAAIYRAYGVAW